MTGPEKISSARARGATRSVLVWQDLEEVAADGVEALYPARLCWLFRFRFAQEFTNSGLWDHMRNIAAEFVASLGRKKPRGFMLKSPAFDLWIGQVCHGGRHVSEMYVCLASRSRLPVRDDCNFLLRHKSLLDEHRGVQPSALGLMPAIGIRSGQITRIVHTFDQLIGLSKLYKEAHGLNTETRDPYTQMMMVEDYPQNFEWHTGCEMGSAEEEIRSASLRIEQLLPADANWSSVEEFALTYNAFGWLGTWEATDAVAVRVARSLRLGEGSQVSIDDLRAALFMTAVKVRLSGQSPNETELNHVHSLIELIRAGIKSRDRLRNSLKNAKLLARSAGSRISHDQVLDSVDDIPGMVGEVPRGTHEAPKGEDAHILQISADFDDEYLVTNLLIEEFRDGYKTLRPGEEWFAWVGQVSYHPKALNFWVAVSSNVPAGALDSISDIVEAMGMATAKSTGVPSGLGAILHMGRGGLKTL